MDYSGNLLAYATGPVQLVGLVMVVLAGLVPTLLGKRTDPKTLRALVLGLIGLGALTIVGGIGLAATSRPSRDVIDNVIQGHRNVVGVDNNAQSDDAAPPVSVKGNTITGNGNAVGVGNRVVPAADGAAK